MAELNSTEEPQILPSKRNQTTDDDSTKKLRPATAAVAVAAVEDKNLYKDGEKHEIEDEEEEEEDDYEGEDEIDSEDEESEAEIDRKGKGIMKDDIGKGKMIEVSEEDDDDSSESDGDDDLSDDPLTEVDLDNILPLRTRRRTAPPGVHISNDA